MRKGKALLIFTDLDDTFTPIGIKDLQEFAKLVRKLKKEDS